MISGHGSISASLMLIGDGCSDEDMQSGYCLSGVTESRFRSFCKEHDINFNDTYRTCLVKDRINLNKPDTNRDKVTNEYRVILSNEIEQINPSIIVPISELSFEFVSGLSGITKFRGSLLPINPHLHTSTGKIIPVLGPAPYINQDPKMEFITRLDFGKIAKNLLSRNEPFKEIGVCWVAKSAESVREFFKRHYQKTIAKSLEEGGFITTDIETYCGLPTCASVCFDGNESMTIPFMDKSISIDERMLMLREYAILLNSPIPKVNQNVKFDWRKLEQRLRIKVNNIVGCSQIAASCLYPEFPKNLGFLVSIYTDMPYFKDEGKQDSKGTDVDKARDKEKFYIYNAKDSLGTHKVHQQQINEMKEVGTWKVYKQIIDILPIYKKMEENGIRIDMEARERLFCKYQTLFEIQVLKIRRLVNEKEFNPLSDDQVRRIVYDELRYQVIRGIKRTKLGKPGTDEESLELLLWMSDYNSLMNGPDILKTVIACRKFQKVLEYLQSPIHPDNRARCEFNLGGAETGRTTASSTTDGMFVIHKGKIKFKEVGHSFQTIGKHGFEVNGITYGKDIRSLFVPSRGYCFVESDLSQAEARVDAVLAKDYDILEIFDGPVGIHRLTGSWIYDCPPEEIKKGILVDGKDRYHESKTVRHAGERNIQEKRLMMMLHRPLRECRDLLKKFHAKQQNIKEVFHREIRETIQQNRSLVAPNGRKRDFFGDFDNHMINEGISYLPQAIVTDDMKQGINIAFNEKHGIDWARPLSESHDSCFVEVPIGRHEEWGQLFKQSVEQPIDFSTCSLSRDFKLTIPCEVEWSDTNWKEMTELKI